MKKLIFRGFPVPKAKKATPKKPAKRKVKIAASVKVIEHMVNGQSRETRAIPGPAQEFSGEIARVFAQWGFSLQIGDGEWQMLRIGVDVPCAVADLPATKERAIADVIQESDIQKKALIARIGQAYFGEQKKSPLEELLQ